MATPGVLTDSIAWSLGVPDTVVAYVWRTLRDNGIVTKGGRGRSAAHVTAMDAAHLIIAAATFIPGRDTIQTWRDFALLPSQAANLQSDFSERLPGIWRLEPLNLPALRQLPEGHSFVSALAGWIESISNGSFDTAYKEIGRIDSTGVPEIFDLYIDLHWPLRAASIRVNVRGYSEQVNYRERQLDPHDANLYLRGTREHPFSNKKREWGDLRQNLMFTRNTIIHAANVLIGWTPGENT